MTNAEKMTKDTERLAKLIRHGSEYPCDFCILRDEDCRKQNMSCKEAIKMWLESEAEE